MVPGRFRFVTVLDEVVNDMAQEESDPIARKLPSRDITREFGFCASVTAVPMELLLARSTGISCRESRLATYNVSFDVPERLPTIRLLYTGFNPTLHVGEVQVARKPEVPGLLAVTVAVWGVVPVTATDSAR